MEIHPHLSRLFLWFSSAHVLIPFLSEMGHTVNLFTRRPEEWKDTVYCEVTHGLTGAVSETHCGTINCKSNDPSKVIPEADIIVLCLPVHIYRPVLDQIAPHINKGKEVFVGTVFGQAGFNWMVSASMVEGQGLLNVVSFAIGSIPWICRARCYGEVGVNFGPMELNEAAVYPHDRFQTLNDIFLEDISYRVLGKGKFVQACSFLDFTLSVDNQILHPARCYGLWKKSGGVWDSLSAVPYFYRDFDQESADILGRLDAEYELIRQSIRRMFPEKDFKYMLGYVELEKLNYKSDHFDILASLKDDVQLASIKTPTVEGSDGRHYLDTNFRFFKDDIPYGLLIAKSLAEMLHIETPFIDEIIGWAQLLRGEMFIKDGRINREYCFSHKYVCGIPEIYRLTKIEDLVQ
jgi:opine dehydrogenase